MFPFTKFHAITKRIDTLIIHNTNYTDVFIVDVKILHELLPHSELLITNELGHTRILRDEKVIEKTVNFF